MVDGRRDYKPNRLDGAGLLQLLPTIIQVGAEKLEINIEWV